MKSLLIVADDLSGAADCAIAFAAAGRKTVVSLDAGASDANATVVAADTDTRRLAPADAAKRTADAWHALRAPGRRLYKKIDSTLRGNWAAEVAALTRVAGPAIVTPAFPATGRTVRDARVFVRGVPLEDTETWQLEHAGQHAGLRELLDAVGLRAAHVPLDAFRAAPQEVALMIASAAASGNGIDAIIVDAETSDDLASLARVSASVDEPFFWVGSGGLARELAALPDLFDTDASTQSASIIEPAQGPILALVGSLSAISERQCALLCAEAGVCEMIVPPAVLRDGARHPQWQTWSARIGDAVRGQEDAIVRIGRDDAFDPAEGARLSNALAALVAPHFDALGGLIATGGETARAMLAAANVGSLELVREIEAGVALGRPSNGKGPSVVTKAGAFGSEHALLGAYLHLRGADIPLAR
ncbi:MULTISPECIES: four-carbon acid sugar kinase family protein [Caballeronia]|uniref:four-carbon acid sugar kinase family protein n=1 Tax=Caballeronia TaxID=1827195 RepID=UPI00158CD6CA|nr:MULTISPECIES: four-carbon acid sugar kinase family protein [Caballeronia]MCG7405605.1 four-carbon acid sugar kinase family protein [Caballeronia zhejiangensis]MCI1047727.1 four-carbon acid sugar kinase family protein [Caballeronia zhejiangensis]